MYIWLKGLLVGSNLWWNLCLHLIQLDPKSWSPRGRAKNQGTCLKENQKIFRKTLWYYYLTVEVFELLLKFELIIYLTIFGFSSKTNCLWIYYFFRIFQLAIKLNTHLMIFNRFMVEKSLTVISFDSTHLLILFLMTISFS